MEEHCIYSDYTIKETIEKFEKNKDRVAIVINKNDIIIGVVSQGDIIRALCYGQDIYSPVSKIVKNTFLYLNDMEMRKAYEIFKKYQITMLPVVDEKFHLKDVITLKDIYNYLEDRK